LRINNGGSRFCRFTGWNAVDPLETASRLDLRPFFFQVRISPYTNCQGAKFEGSKGHW
jgi:hypothetical protein